MKILFILAMLFSNQSQPRKVLLFYDQSKPELWQTQVDSLAHYQKEMDARELVIYSYEKNQNPKEWKKLKIDESSLFTFVLIGKDGGEKFRSEKLVDHKQLFGLVDAMPMRRYEMQQKKR